MTDLDALDYAPAARDLTHAVHARDPERVHDILDNLDTHGLHTIAVLLADVVGPAAADALDALVGRDKHGIPAVAAAWTDEELREAHAAWSRRENTPWARAGEREYQRRRAIRRRKLAALERQVIENRKAAS